MKKAFIYLSFAVFFAFSSFGITDAYSGWIYNNNEFSFDGIDYDVVISKGGSSIVLVSEDSINIELSSCKHQDFRKFCYNSSFYDTQLKEYKAYLNIYYLKPEITIERTITDTSLEVGETSEITIQLENTGDEDATVEFYDELPRNAKITSVDNAEISGSSIIWEGEIEPDETYEITYEIKSMGSFDLYTKARAKYFDGLNEVTVFSEQANLVSLEPLEFELSFDKEEYGLNENVNLTIEITNNPEEDVDLNLELLLPENVDLVKEPSNFENLKFSDEISNDTTFLFVLKPKETANTVITLKGDYYYKQKYLVEERLDFDLENEGITITSSLEDESEGDSGKPFKIWVKAKNDNLYSDIKNVKIGVISDLGIINTTLPFIKVNQTAFLINTEIKAPRLNESKSFPIRLNVTYETEDGKKYSETWSESLIVKPISTLKIEISGSEEAYENTPIEFTVTLENPTKEDIDKIFVKAAIPKIFKVKGVTSAYTSVNASKSIDALSFTIIPDYVSGQEYYNITVTAEYDSLISKSKKITIKPKKPEITLSRSLSGSSVYQGDLIDVTYSIGNSDTVDINSLTLVPAKSQSFDTIGVFEINITDLIAGKKINLDGEQLRAKKAGKLGKAILYYKDSKNRRFNVTLEEAEIEVKEGRIKDPALLLELSHVNKSIEYKTTNIGNGKATLENREIDDESYLKDAKIGEVQFYQEYDLFGKKARAYSNLLNVVIINETQPVSEETAAKPDVIENQDVPAKEEKRTSIWIRMYHWFIGLFRK